MPINKAARFFVIAIVLGIQITFLAFIVKEQYETNNFTVLLSILLVILVLLFGHKYLDLHHEEHSYEKLSVIIWVPIGAVICYLLNVNSDLGSVLSAGIIGTLASFIPLISKKSNYLEQLPPAIYCGVFIGMSSAEITPSIGFVVIAGAVAGLFFLLSKNLFLGIGGKLGTIAFIGVAIVSLLKWLTV